MVHVRAEKVARIADDIPTIEVRGPQSGDMLVLGWGSTYGAISSAVTDLVAKGIVVSQAHVRYLNPLPKNLGEVLRRFRRVLLPEMNSGQLAMILRARYLIDIVSYSKVQGQPFKRREIMARIEKELGVGR
jgi:2-oxoglutarate ferredoxin oxidoreductase subunit alpha